MRARKQTGQIVAIGSRWFLRYWERRMRGGVLERKRVTHALGPITTRGKRPPADVVSEGERHMLTVNACSIAPDQVITFADFVVNHFLPWTRDTKRASTLHGYTDVWENHLKPLASREKGNLKDIRTVTVQRWLNQLGQEDLSRNTLKRIKSVISGAFKQAKRLGFFDGVNPAVDTLVNPRAAAPAETYAYSLEQVEAILAALPEPASTVFAVAAYAGLRRGEVEALDWSDYHDGVLQVERSIWNGRMTAPKTAKSRAAVPVIRQLAERLEFHRLRSGSPQRGPMFVNSVGQRLCLNNLLNRQILPALNVCRHCGVSEGKPHLKQDHDYERDDRVPQWRGFHSARRGLGSNLYRLGVPDKVIQAILRHSNVSVTLSYYIKSNSSDVVEAMEKLEENLAEKTAGQNLRDSSGTVKPDSGATPGFVN